MGFFDSAQGWPPAVGDLVHVVMKLTDEQPLARIEEWRRIRRADDKVIDLYRVRYVLFRTSRKWIDWDRMRAGGWCKIEDLRPADKIGGEI